MPRALTVCPTAGCPNTTTGGRCPACKARADRVRGTATQRGYTGRGHRFFRRAVLRRDPLCVCTNTSHGHGTQCGQPATDADHHPVSRRDLVAAGLNPNDPARGRGLCGPCHSAETAAHQPGGWHQR